MFEEENPCWLPYCTLLRDMTVHLGICEVSSKMICLTVELSGVSAILTNSAEYYLFYMFKVRLQEITLKTRRAVIHFLEYAWTWPNYCSHTGKNKWEILMSFFLSKLSCFFLLVEVITFKIWMNTQKDHMALEEQVSWDLEKEVQLHLIFP